MFGSVEFAAVQRDLGGADPRLFVLDSPHGPIAHPLLLRPVADLDLDAGSSRDLFDAATPEYTGPLAAGLLDDAARRAFADELSSWCAATGIVTEFGHLHPWKARTELLDAAAIEREREIVYVDLTQIPSACGASRSPTPLERTSSAPGARACGCTPPRARPTCASSTAYTR